MAESLFLPSTCIIVFVSFNFKSSFSFRIVQLKCRASGLFSSPSFW